MGGPPYTIRVHGSDIFYDCPGLYLKEKFAHAKAIVCISDFCRSQVLCMIPPDQWSKVSVVRCGVDPQRFLPRRERLHDQQQEVVVFLCVARILRAKGLHFLIRACSCLLEKGIQLKCVLVGDGPAREELQAFTNELGMDRYVEFVGSVGQDRIQAYYEQADIFVLPSFAEGVPVVLMEAMAKEVPVITTRVMGIPELVEDGVHGLLIPPASVEALANAIQRLAKDPQLRQRLGKAGRQKVIAEYNIAANVAKLAQILQYSADGKLADKKVSTEVI
jgi:glycosyltransferase involved in cell wall biosynthesis